MRRNVFGSHNTIVWQTDSIPLLGGFQSLFFMVSSACLVPLSILLINRHIECNTKRPPKFEAYHRFLPIICSKYIHAPTKIWPKYVATLLAVFP